MTSSAVRADDVSADDETELGIIRLPVVRVCCLFTHRVMYRVCRHGYGAATTASLTGLL